MNLLAAAIIQALLGTFTAQNCKVDPAMPNSLLPTNAVTVTIESGADNGVEMLFDDVAHSVSQEIEFSGVNGAPYTVTGQRELADGDLDVHTLALNHDGSVLFSEQYTFAETGVKVAGSCFLKRQHPSNP